MINKGIYVKTLKSIIKKCYEIPAYAVMDNHYHLLIKTNKSTIREIMFYINNFQVYMLMTD